MKSIMHNTEKKFFVEVAIYGGRVNVPVIVTVCFSGVSIVQSACRSETKTQALGINIMASRRRLLLVLFYCGDFGPLGLWTIKWVR